MTTPQFRPLPLALGGFLAMASAIGIGRFIYTPILPPMAEALGLSQGEAGLIASANYLGYLIGALGAAWPGLARAPRGWMLFMLAVCTLTTTGMGAAESMSAFYLLRFIGGAASAYVLVLASTLVLERLAASGHGGLSAVHFAGVGMAIAASAALIAVLNRSGIGWPAMWYGGGIMMLAALAGVAILVPADPKTARNQTNSGASHPALPLWPMALAYGLFGFGYIITATFIVAIVREAPDLREVEPLIWIVVGLAAAPSVAAWTALGRRVGHFSAYAIACVVEAVGIVASVTIYSTTGILLAAMFLGGTFMGLTAAGILAVRSIPGAGARRSLALVTAAFGVGQMVGPTVAGYAHDLTGSFLLPSLLAAGMLCVAAALALFMQSRLKRELARQEQLRQAPAGSAARPALPTGRR